MQRSPGARGQAGLSQGECPVPQASQKLSGSPHRLVGLLPGGGRVCYGCIIGRVFGVVRGLLLGVWNQRAGQDYTVCAIYLCMSVCVSVIYETDHVCIYS